MILGLLLHTAIAGQWLPAESVELDETQTIQVEQTAGAGLLFQISETEAKITVKSDGIALPMSAGPQGTMLIRPALRSRTLEVHSTAETQLHTWRETKKGDAATWDRFESKLAGWMRKGNAFPQSPRAIAALQTELEARREAFLANNTKVPTAFLMALAQLELEAYRARSKADHGYRSIAEGQLPEEQDWSLQVQGPGVLTLSIRPEMGGKIHRRFEILAIANGEAQKRSTFSSAENPEHPGLGNLRHFSVVAPPGISEWTFRTEGANLRLQAELHELRPTLRSFLQGWRRQLTQKTGALYAMEVAHVHGKPKDVTLHAKALLDTHTEDIDPVRILAVARLIEHSPNPEDAIAYWDAYDGRQVAVFGTALMKRWQLRQDIPLQHLVDAAELLPADPTWLAELADSLPAGFIRPRGQAIRELAELPIGPDTHSRWTALIPETPLEVLHLAGIRGGIGRVLIREGQAARVRLPQLPNNRLPLLRLYTETETRYTVNGESRDGQGDLFEALEPGVHVVRVEAGSLLLLDGELAIGGQFLRERPVTGLPGTFNIPDPGTPAEVEVLITGGSGTVYARNDIGETWALQAKAGLNRFSLRPGAWTQSLSFEGPKQLRVSLGLRRALEIDEPFASPDVLSDPLTHLHSTSAALRDAKTSAERVGLRLLRAAALEALGLSRSARKEAKAAALTEGSTAKQRRIAEVILRESQPLAHSAEQLGPTTLDAAAAIASLPVPETMEELLEAITLLDPDEAGPVHVEIATRHLAAGTIAPAWEHAVLAGPMGRILRLRIESAGSWSHISRVDKDNGTTTQNFGRVPAGLGSTPLRLAQEALVGAPWPAQDFLLLHDKKAAEIALPKQGKARFDLVCTDWGHRTNAPVCLVPFTLNGATELLEIPANQRISLDHELVEKTNLVRIGPLKSTEHSLAVHTMWNGEVYKPINTQVRHRIGGGITLRVQGESLLRIKAHGPVGSVRVRADDDAIRIQGEGILPLHKKGFRTVTITGPSAALVSLSRLTPKAVPRPTAPAPIRSSLEKTVDQQAATAAEHWMSEVALSRRGAPFAVGRGGTFSAFGTSGVEQSGQRDHQLQYIYGGAGMSWRQRLPNRSDWLALSTQSRGGPSGHPSVSGALSWVHLEPTWATKTSIDSGYSGGAWHVALDAHARALLPLSPHWSLAPFLNANVGHWSEGIGDPVDPMVWNTYNLDHFWGIQPGVMADWRWARNARMRIATHLKTTPDLELNWAEGFWRGDLLVGHNMLLTVIPAIGHRFSTQLREESYWRPRLTARLTYAGYATPKFRFKLASQLQWLPLQDSVEGGLTLEMQASPQRGLRDVSPLDQPFNSAFDSRVEQP